MKRKKLLKKGDAVVSIYDGHPHVKRGRVSHYNSENTIVYVIHPYLLNCGGCIGHDVESLTLI